MAMLLHFNQSIYVFCWMHDIFFFLCYCVILILISHKFLLYVKILFRFFVCPSNFFSEERVFFLSLGSLGQLEICYVLQN